MPITVICLADHHVPSFKEYLRLDGREVSHEVLRAGAEPTTLFVGGDVPDME